ncbi:MAG: PEP-CTERM sorting domain-containing protein [Chromatiales bacterium]|nr:PEP-CTERM sorting domain-containing protein [Chromatiales bacterium]
MTMKILSAVILLSALVVGSQASAASLSLFTSTPQVSGPTVTVTVQAAGFTNLTSGGDFSLAFDAAALSLVGVDVPNPPFDTITVDSSPSALNRVDVFKSSTGYVGPSFDVATITFNILPGFGTGTALQLQSSFVGWFEPDATTAYDVTYGGLQLTAVPAPGALWLLATGVGALVARRQLRGAR